MALGPLALLGVWALLPAGSPEGLGPWDDRLAHQDGVLAELVGYTVEAPRDGKPRLLGQGPEADRRLAMAPIPPRTGWLTPPHGDQSHWTLTPAHHDHGLRLLSSTSDADRASAGSPAVPSSTRRTWVRPWGPDGFGAIKHLRRTAVHLSSAADCSEPTARLEPTRLTRLRLEDRGQGEPRTLWLPTPEGEESSRVATDADGEPLEVRACADGSLWWLPLDDPGLDHAVCAGDRGTWRRVRSCWWGSGAVCAEPLSRPWGVRVHHLSKEGEDASWLLPWGTVTSDRFGLSFPGAKLDAVRLGFATVDRPTVEASTVDTPLHLCSAEDGTTVDDPGQRQIGPLALEDGSVLAIGRTRFLVHDHGTEDRAALSFIHVRNPRAPGALRWSSGHGTYHPNRRALWHVPPCGAAEASLGLVIEPRGPVKEADPAELAMGDRALRDRLDAAQLNRGVSRELSPVDPDPITQRHLLELCSARGEGDMRHARLWADVPGGLLTHTAAEHAFGGEGRRLPRAKAMVSLGTATRPTEALVEFGGHWIRIAPAQGQAITRGSRLGLWIFLTVVLWLQAIPSTLARRAEATASIPAGARSTVPWEPWPVALHSTTLQQLVGIAIACLLFLGASFQLFLGLHPQLAGKTDYAQAFFLGVVVVTTVLLGAAGLCVGVGWTRLASAGLWSGLGLWAAAAWWWWDGLGREPSWFNAGRDAAVAAASSTPNTFGLLLFLGGCGAVLGAALLHGLRSLGLRALGLRSLGLRSQSWVAAWSIPHSGGAAGSHDSRPARLALEAPLVGFVLIALAGLGVGWLQRSALAFELGILAGLAWYGGVYWAFVRRGRLVGNETPRRRAAILSQRSGMVLLAFIALFFIVGADLPDGLSFALLAIGALCLGVAGRSIVRQRFIGLLRVLTLWLAASVVGMGFASGVLTDMGSVAAWVPALLAGLFLWLVRPEESENRAEEPEKARVHMWLAFGLGCMLLALLDVFTLVLPIVDWQVLERPQQRLALAEDISYITAGEWITQVRWLASQRSGDLMWVPNVNSDIAIFGLSAHFGAGVAALASLLLLAVAGASGLAADQALRQARLAAHRDHDRMRPTLLRALGLFSGMVCVLLMAQWLVHLATGVVIHLPITGLVFPWISHGNTTHLLYTAAILLPMAAITTLSPRESHR